jgi:Restriction endonuclease BglII
LRFERESLNGGLSKIPSGMLTRVEHCLHDIKLSKSHPSAPDLRAKTIMALRDLGWSNEIQLDPTCRITINGVFERVGLAVQMGNICRFYADIIKLQTLFIRDKVAAALYIVAVKRLAAQMGKNLANYERVTQEMQLFYQTINVPVVVFGLEVD